MNLRNRVSKFIRSVGGYALISNLLALALVLLVLLNQLGPIAAAILWMVVAAVEFVTRGHLRTLAKFGVQAVARGQRDWHTLSTGHANRVLGAAGAVVFAFQQGSSTFVRVVSVVIALIILAEPITASLMRKSSPTFTQVPWRAELSRPFHLRFHAYLLNVLLVAGSYLLSLGVGSRVIAVAIALCTVAIQIAMSVRSLRRMRQKQDFETHLHEDLEAFQPKFYFYWDASAGTVFQAEMWIPYLEQLGERYCIILRNTANYHDLREITDAPIIVRPAMADLDAMVVPSVKATFYVNNAIRNAHFARFFEITHIQLNHGDSDKPPSFNPVMRMYDRNFVAGQAAIDRYSNHGIETSDNFFEIVGRPQIESITGPMSESEDVETVLYAPTWAGFMADSALSSLPLGPAMIAELIRLNKRVIFRPHPHSRNNPELAAACEQIIELLAKDNAATQRGHLYGDQAESIMSIVDCFNESDAMIADVSSVVPDYLYSTKPFAVVAMGFDTADEFLEENPVARASYIIEKDGSNLTTALGQLVSDDQLKALRQQFRLDYLGDFDCQPYSQRFLDVAQRYLV